MHSIFLVAHVGVVAQKAKSLYASFPSINWFYNWNLDGLRTVKTDGWSLIASGIMIQYNEVVVRDFRQVILDGEQYHVTLTRNLILWALDLG